MDFGLWEKYYKKILDDFGFQRSDDEKSAKLLDEILSIEGCLRLDELGEILSFSDKYIVFGAGPSIEKHIQLLKKEYDLKNYVLVAADGATSALIKEKIIPDVVVTDLDGKLDDILFANIKGANIVIHAHGDNIDKIASLTPFFNNVVGTTQSQPIGNLYNFGGFTDGDRAIFISVVLGASQIILAGMDFGDMVTNYSRPNSPNKLSKADDFKKKKLEYAEFFTDWIKENKDVEIINLID